MPGTFEQLLFARAFARSKRLQSLIGIYLITTAPYQPEKFEYSTIRRP
jgi:hypothetical protein